MQKILKILLISFLSYSCQSIEHHTYQQVHDFKMRKGVLKNGTPVFYLDEKTSSCMKRRYVYSIEAVGPISPWLDQDLKMCFRGMGSSVQNYILNQAFFRKVRKDLVRKSGLN